MKKLSKLVIRSAFDIAEKIGAKKVLIYGDVVDDLEMFLDTLKDISSRHEIILSTHDINEIQPELRDAIKHIIKIPKVELTRIGQIKMAIMMGLSAKIIKREDKIVCISGISRFKTLDNLVVLDISKEFELLTSKDLYDISKNVKPEVFEGLFNLAIELANQGREGKPIGAIFVLGDHERVLPLSRQMIINPFKGYPEEDRNILDPKLKETVKEFAVMDGAFIIRGDGILISAGRHLSAAYEGEDLPQGLGSRHVAAAGITEATEAIAIVISESTGSVRIFKKGKILIEIEPFIK